MSDDTQVCWKYKMCSWMFSAADIQRKEAPKKNMNHSGFSSFWLSEVEDCQEATCCLIWLKTCIFFKVLSLWWCVCVCALTCVCVCVWVCARTPVEELSGSLKPVPFSVYLFTYCSSCYSAFFFPLLCSPPPRKEKLFFLLFFLFEKIKKRENCCCGSRDRRP